MCDKSCINFGIENLHSEQVKDKRVLEIGSYDFNGSLKNHVLSLDPIDYIGVDIIEGKNVDVICKAENLLDIYGKESFDVIITTEMLEHVFDWKRVINNIKLMCKHGGTILITTRSYGFPLHGYPFDHWRYETYDMKYIFSDFNEHGKTTIQNDPQNRGVFVYLQKPIKPIDFRMINIDDYRLYNIIYDLRI